MLTLNNKWLMAIRISTALFVGYALTILYSILLSKILMLLGVTKVNATVSMQLLSFFIYAMVAIWVFSISSLKRLWVQIIYSALISVVLIYLIDMGLKL